MGNTKENETANRSKVAVKLLLLAIVSLFHPLLFRAFVFFLGSMFTQEAITQAKQNWAKLNNRERALFVSFLIQGVSGLVSMGYARGQKGGITRLFAVAFAVMATDIFAYFGGKKYGRTPFFPATSPNKTWEGTIAGLIGGAGFFWGVLKIGKRFSDPGLPLRKVVALMILVPVASVMGDLLESKVKRKLGIKDFSQRLGDHGGFPDRLDSHVTAWNGYLVVS